MDLNGRFTVGLSPPAEPQEFILFGSQNVAAGEGLPFSATQLPQSTSVSTIRTRKNRNYGIHAPIVLFCFSTSAVCPQVKTSGEKALKERKIELRDARLWCEVPLHRGQRKS